ncbi:hypothetical protein R4Y45_06200 [Holzapfeliella sp. He02]|uniref:Uncharacterized protein n=1 Tax=Holzapfeliella saturejae TaxID=3082953 RepID=A0ABU8SHF4_9LACO
MVKESTKMFVVLSPQLAYEKLKELEKDKEKNHLELKELKEAIHEVFG